MRGPIVLLLAVAVLVPGCLDRVGGPDVEVRTLYSDERAFAFSDAVDPTSPPTAPDQAYAHHEATFDVPEDSDVVTVGIDVSFLETQGGLGVTDDLRDVEVVLSDPAGDAVETWSFSDDGSVDWRQEPPEPGTWTLTYRVRGDVVITTFVNGVVPV